MEIITLDLIPSGVMPVCHASRNDSGRVIRICFTEGGQPIALDGSEILTFTGKRPDGRTVSFDLENLGGGVDYADLITTPELTAFDGVVENEIRYKKTDLDIGSLNFLMFVENSVDGSPAPTPPTPARRGGLNATIYEIISTTYETI